MKTFKEIYYSVSVNECKYFKKKWLEQTGLSDRQFKNRLENPTIDDIALLCQTCKIPPAVALAPILEKYKNVPPFNTNLKTSI